MIELDYRVEGIVDGADTPESRRKLVTADLYNLTYDMFWGDLVFRVEGADFGGPGPVFDVAYVLFCVAQDLQKQPKRTYSAAEGAGECQFHRKGDLLQVREENGPRGVVLYEDFCSATIAFLRTLVDDLCGRYPELRRNAEISKIRRRLLSSGVFSHCLASNLKGLEP
ncbi:hypothetical protein [Streptomyces sp. HYC2]|uniref:hypothetical protein n=1 Tax=Streptomyces sp. HYC2 TaxID=2955207 RepID=UPI0024807BD5|nr:hypothetical protein [Streptomyces sp. HYC2]